MSEVIDIYNNWKGKKRDKKFTLKFDEVEIEVPLEKYLEVTRHGIEKYEFKDNEIVLRPVKKAFQPYQNYFLEGPLTRNETPNIEPNLLPIMVFVEVRLGVN